MKHNRITILTFNDPSLNCCSRCVPYSALTTLNTPNKPSAFPLPRTLIHLSSPNTTYPKPPILPLSHTISKHIPSNPPPIPSHSTQQQQQITMPPKRAPTATPTTSSAKSNGRRLGSGQPQSGVSQVGGALRNTYEALTAKENQSVVRAVGMFGVS